MTLFKADLHVHTLLSPCGDLEMSPKNIIREAKRKKIDILGITDHNSTKQAELLVELGKEANILVLPGCEVNTKEEVHCVTLFENIETANRFQLFLDSHLSSIPNNVDLFGHQVVVDRDENIIEVEERALFVALKVSVFDVQEMVESLSGIFFPAHIDRRSNGILSQLGFIPDDLKFDALEISYRVSVDDFQRNHPELANSVFIRNSDAHYPESLGRAYTLFDLSEKTFSAIKQVLYSKDKNKIILR